MKYVLLSAVVLASVALGACRREHPTYVPMKLGADVNAQAVR